MAKPKLQLASFTGVVNVASKTTKPDAEIDLSLIDVEPQVRTDLGDLSELVASIAAHGVDTPIILLAKGDGRYRLVAGERRFRSSLLANKTTIPALIKTNLSEFDVRGYQIRENNQRKDLSLYDKAMGVAQDVEQYGFNAAKEIWEQDDTWVSKHLAVKRYATPVLNILQNGSCVDLEILHSLNILFELSKEEFGFMVRRIKSGQPLSRAEVRDKVSAIKRWNEQIKQRKAAANAKSKSQVKQDKKTKIDPEVIETDKPANLETTSAGVSISSAIGGKTSIPSTQDNAPSLTSEEAEAIDRGLAQKAIQSFRNQLFHSGNAVKEHIDGITSRLDELGYDMNDAEWVLWSGFLSSVLPMMHALGNERSLSYIKRLQAEFKTSTPILLWRLQHPLEQGADPEQEDSPRISAPEKPSDWRL